MTKDERSLLLYLETRMVDYDGIIDPRMMNEPDFEIAKRWDREGFIKFGRLKMREIKFLDEKFRNAKTRTHAVRFTTKAWEAAHRERRARSARMIERWEKDNFLPAYLDDSEAETGERPVEDLTSQQTEA
jgi:hypothetical protein